MTQLEHCSLKSGQLELDYELTTKYIQGAELLGDIVITWRKEMMSNQLFAFIFSTQIYLSNSLRVSRALVHCPLISINFVERISKGIVHHPLLHINLVEANPILSQPLQTSFQSCNNMVQYHICCVVIANNDHWLLWNVYLELKHKVKRISFYNKANLREWIAGTGLVILLKFDSNRQFFSAYDLQM